MVVSLWVDENFNKLEEIVYEFIKEKYNNLMKNFYMGNPFKMIVLQIIQIHMIVDFLLLNDIKM